MARPRASPSRWILVVLLGMPILAAIVGCCWLLGLPDVGVEPGVESTLPASGEPATPDLLLPGSLGLDEFGP